MMLRRARLTNRMSGSTIASLARTTSVRGDEHLAAPVWAHVRVQGDRRVGVTRWCLCRRCWGHVQLPVDDLVPLAIVGQLEEVLIGVVLAFDSGGKCHRDVPRCFRSAPGSLSQRERNRAPPLRAGDDVGEADIRAAQRPGVRSRSGRGPAAPPRRCSRCRSRSSGRGRRGCPDWPNSSTPSGTTRAPKALPRKLSACEAPSWTVTIGARRSSGRISSPRWPASAPVGALAQVAPPGFGQAVVEQAGAGDVDDVRGDALLVEQPGGLDRLRDHRAGRDDLDGVALVAGRGRRGGGRPDGSRRPAPGAAASPRRAAGCAGSISAWSTVLVVRRR